MQRSLFIFISTSSWHKKKICSKKEKNRNKRKEKKHIFHSINKNLKQHWILLRQSPSILMNKNIFLFESYLNWMRAGKNAWLDSNLLSMEYLKGTECWWENWILVLNICGMTLLRIVATVQFNARTHFTVVILECKTVQKMM